MPYISWLTCCFIEKYVSLAEAHIYSRAVLLNMQAGQPHLGHDPLCVSLGQVLLATRCILTRSERVIGFRVKAQMQDRWGQIH